MKRTGWLVIGGIVLILLLWGCVGYNGPCSTADQNVKKVGRNVETNYQRRTDLYSSVIKTVEASANFEKSTLNAVVEARQAQHVSVLTLMIRQVLTDISRRRHNCRVHLDDCWLWLKIIPI
jgi:hypothetical protein